MYLLYGVDAQNNNELVAEFDTFEKLQLYVNASVCLKESCFRTKQVVFIKESLLEGFSRWTCTEQKKVEVPRNPTPPKG